MENEISENIEALEEYKIEENPLKSKEQNSQIIKEDEKLKKLKKIITNSICEIITTNKKNIFLNDKLIKKKGTKKKGIGIFIKLEPNSKMGFLLTTNQILNADDIEYGTFQIKYGDDNNLKNIEIESRKTYTEKNLIEYNEKYYYGPDFTLIEFYEKDQINQYLNIDENFTYKDDIKKDIYIIDSQKLNNEESTDKKDENYFWCLNGKIKNLKEFNIFYNSEYNIENSGAPIIYNNEDTPPVIIGIHKNSNSKEKVGTSIKYIVYNARKYLFSQKIKEVLKYFDGDKNSFNIKKDELEKLILEYNYKIGIELENSDIDDNKLNFINSFQFKNLSEFILKNNFVWKGNKIKNVNLFCDYKFNNLEILNLECNLIEDINPLKNANFKNLKKLNLCYNKIKDINVLINENFQNLEILNLEGNKINDINCLENGKFNYLKKLFLNENQIEDIKVFKNNSTFQNLEILNLEWNHIEDIKNIEEFKFMNLKKLYLKYNKIHDLNNLTTSLKEIFKNLEIL